MPNEEGQEKEMDIMNLILNQRNQEQTQSEKYCFGSWYVFFSLALV